MKKIKLPIVLLFAITVSLFSCKKEIDYNCGENLFVENVFDDIEIETVQYGFTEKSNGSEYKLMMDIYHSASAPENRPVVIWAFGGAFVQGDRKQLEAYARHVAEKGYVGICIDYRLLDLSNGFPTEEQFRDIAVKAVSDMNASVRYTKYLAAGENKFKINPDKIFIGGLSAGAITAVMVGAIDETDLIDSTNLYLINQNGGFKGNSGLAVANSYNNDVSGVISLSGGIFDINWIDAEDPPIYNYHGTADDIVPYDFGFVEPFGVQILEMYGSKQINNRAESLGIRTQIRTVNGGTHTNIYGAGGSFPNDYEAMFEEFPQFLLVDLCE
ncbi:MAG: alpha/beta hydrolase [Chitinophagales bacterium]